MVVTLMMVLSGVEVDMVKKLSKCLSDQLLSMVFGDINQVDFIFFSCHKHASCEWGD